MSDKCTTCGKSTSYNGYSNYETWATMLWIDNEQSLQEQFYDSARETYQQTENYFDTKSQLAGELKDFVDEFNPLADQATMYSDLLGAAISEINFWELSAYIVDEIRSEHTHYIGKYGLQGCFMPDYCEPYFTREQAIDAMCDMYELSEEQREILVNDDSVQIDENNYISVTECNCDNPQQHSESEVEF